MKRPLLPAGAYAAALSALTHLSLAIASGVFDFHAEEIAIRKE